MSKASDSFGVIGVALFIACLIFTSQFPSASAKTYTSDPMPGGMCRCISCNCFMEEVEEEEIVAVNTPFLESILSSKQFAAVRLAYTWTNNPVTNPGGSTIPQDNSSNTSAPRPSATPSASPTSNSNTSAPRPSATPTSNSGNTWTNNPVTNPGGSTITQDRSSSNTSSPRPSNPNTSSNTSSSQPNSTNPSSNTSAPRPSPPPSGSTITQDNSSSRSSGSGGGNTSANRSNPQPGQSTVGSGGSSSSGGSNTPANRPSPPPSNSATGKANGEYPYNSSRGNPQPPINNVRQKFFGNDFEGTIELVERSERSRVRVADAEGFIRPYIESTSYDPRFFGEPGQFWRIDRLKPDPNDASTDRVGPILMTKEEIEEEVRRGTLAPYQASDGKTYYLPPEFIPRDRR